MSAGAVDPGGLDRLRPILAALPRISPSGPWIAGGAVRRALAKEPHLDADFDFFFRSEEQFADFCCGLLNRRMRKTRETRHHVQFHGGLLGSDRTIQCVRFTHYETPQAVVDSFDFTICQFAFDGEKLYCGEHAGRDLAARELVVHKVTYPSSTRSRMWKYVMQGYKATPETRKLVAEASGSDEDDLEYEAIPTHGIAAQFRGAPQPRGLLDVF